MEGGAAIGEELWKKNKECFLVVGDPVWGWGRQKY